MKKDKKIKRIKGKSKSAPVIANKSRFPMLRQIESSIDDVPLEKYTQQALTEYGSYVVEDRAVPDFRDGLKPVHRAVMWSLADLGLRPSSGYKKAARTVGDAIGKYHPHGDQACYGAMVTIANTMPPMVDGQGNWGTPLDNAAAMRYTEARMSKFANMFMLDKDYLEVVPKVPNFSNDAVIPLYLPALMPYLLFNGSVPPPAYGVRAGNPSFSFVSVANVVTQMLAGKTFKAEALSKQLELQHPYGCVDITEDEAFLELIETGKGSVRYTANLDVDYKTRTININCFIPGSLSSLNNVDKTLAKLATLKGAKLAYSMQGKKSKGSGPFGALFVIEAQRSISEDDFYSLAERVQKEITSSVSYRLGVTIRKAEESNKFKYLSFVSFLNAWIKYRIALEVKLLKHQIVKAERDLHYQEVYLFAVENMEQLLKILPRVLTSNDPDATLAKAMKIPVEDAKIILDRKVRQLAKMEAAAIKAEIKRLKDLIKKLKLDLKEPGQCASRKTAELVEAYLKNPDTNTSGLPFVEGGPTGKKKRSRKK